MEYANWTGLDQCPPMASGVAAGPTQSTGLKLGEGQSPERNEHGGHVGKSRRQAL